MSEKLPPGPMSARDPDRLKNWAYAKKREIYTKTFKVLVFQGASCVYVDYVDSEGRIFSNPLRLDQSHEEFIQLFEQAYKTCKTKSEPTSVSTIDQDAFNLPQVKRSGIE